MHRAPFSNGSDGALHFEIENPTVLPGGRGATSFTAEQSPNSAASDSADPAARLRYRNSRCAGELESVIWRALPPVRGSSDAQGPRFPTERGLAFLLQAGGLKPRAPLLFELPVAAP